jgi:methyltransferase (TIGR00027 family)
VAEALIENVSDTAFWVAHYRGLETRRSDALFQDPLASLLAGERGKQIAQAMPGRFITSWMVAIRTCLIDDYIRFALAQGIDTVLNLGAGLDTRPYRMDLPSSLVWVEVDYQNVIEFKEERLSRERPRCQLSRIKLDLANVAERREMLGRLNARARKMLVLTEGVVPYLSVEDVGALADDLKALDRASYWIVDYFAPQAFKGRQRRMGHRMRNAPFKFQPDDWFAFFEKHGWRCEQIRYLAEEARRLKRPLRLPLFIKVIWGIRSLFMSEEQRAAVRKIAGYALLEPAPTITDLSA